VLGAAAVAVIATAPAPLAFAGGPPDVTGKRYGDASSVLQNAGFSPVVSTTVGDRVPWSECLVTFVRAHNAAPPPNSHGSVTHQALVSLNCDAAAASATKPGYSAQSPEGRAIATSKAATSG
jgi:beta-lactam-binding protein with PASTA domain